MITSLLFNEAVQIAYLCATMITAILTGIYVASNQHFMTEGVKQFCMTAILVSSVLFAAGLFFNANVKYEKIYASDWKQLYSNDIKADITIDTFFGMHFKAGEATGVSLKELQRQLYLNGTVTATGASDSKESRTFALVQDGISTTGEVDKTSKIVKVEYRPIEGKRRSAFGLQSSIYKAKTDGELRITVEGHEKSDELKKLFD